MPSKASVKRIQFCNFKLDVLQGITLAINDNVPVEGLLNQFESVLVEKLNIGKLLLYSYNKKWECLLRYGVHRNISEGIIAETDLLYYKQITNLTVALNPNLEVFDAIIPVYHHNAPIAYVIIGDIDEERAGMSPTIKHLHFIQTLANIIVVAIENKHLFDENIKQEAIRKELELASRMQNMLIPNPASLPNNKQLHASAYYLPHFEVGGDYYDFIKLNDKEYGFCIADVSGKGISAALLMSNFQANIRALIDANTSLTKTINKLNDRVMASANGEKFITLFIGIYNTKTRELNYINAGHNPPLFYNKENNQCSLLTIGCTGVGMFDQIPTVKEGSLNIPKGSRLICYTDGIVELENDKGKMFGTEPIEKHVKGPNSMRLIIDDVVEELNDFKGKRNFFDDISILGIEFH